MDRLRDLMDKNGLVFQHVDIHCEFKNMGAITACLDPELCMWKVNLMSCQSLQMHCIDNHERKSTESADLGRTLMGKLNKRGLAALSSLVFTSARI
ncbi:hypothetical protein SRHO_G00208330 [Serrasalmus rhombeus]